MRIVVMGVTGCGKSSVGKRIAEHYAVEFLDADDFHPASNVQKMSAAIPLTDEDRWPWLARLSDELASRDNVVLACSALKRSYREVLRGNLANVVFVHLAAPQAVLEDRVRRRTLAEGHFAPAGLLDSQYAALENLSFDETGVAVDVATAGVEQAAAEAIAWLES